MHRVLVVTEFSGLSTGYATYGRNILYNLNKHFHVAEFASYVHRSNPEINRFPWKIYDTLPTNDEEVKVYESDPSNQFGKYKFEHACLDFKPTIVIAFRDWWMDSYILDSPFRRCFNFVWMPTVDSIPQEEQWMYSFAEADGIFTYQDWSLEQLRKQGGDNINLLGSAPPCASQYTPMDGNRIKSNFGLDKYKIVGTVMRNQQRKFYPDLFIAFRDFLDRTKRNDVLLYCHTAHPDLGWDIPRLLKEYGLSSKVLFTYKCRNCESAYPSFFLGEINYCGNCGEKECRTANVQDGCSEKVMNMIYSMFDVYVQYSSNEGFGIPMIEAAACGVPVCGINYSAMEDVLEKINGYPISPITLQKDVHTGAYRAVASNNSLVEFLMDFFEKPEDEIKVIREKTIEGYNRYYSDWENTANKWKDYIDTVDYQHYNNIWKSPPKVHNPRKDIPKGLSNSDYARFLISDVLGSPEKLGSYLELRLIRDLNRGSTSRTSPGYYNDLSQLFAKPQVMKFDRETAYNMISGMVNKNNFWEEQRVKYGNS